MQLKFFNIEFKRILKFRKKNLENLLKFIFLLLIQQ